MLLPLLQNNLLTGGGPQNYGYTGTGGDIDGGAAAYLRSVGFTGAGGDLDGGAAVYLRSVGFSASGGDIDGGAATVVGTLGRSGGGTLAPKFILVNGKMVAVQTSPRTYEKM